MTGPGALQEMLARACAGLDPASRELVTDAAAEHELDARILASLDHSPDRLKLYLAFYHRLVTGPLGSDRLKKVIQRRVADLTQLREGGQLGQGASPDPPAGLTMDELALVRFMDAWAIDHQSVEPGVYDELRRHFSDAELTELLWAVAIMFATARVGATLGIAAFPSS